MKMIQAMAVMVLAAITHLCTVFGLIVILPAWLAAVLVGGMVALVSRADWKCAFGGTLAGLGLGALIAQPWFLGSPFGQITDSLVFVALGAFSAGVLAFALAATAHRKNVEWLAAIGFVLAIVALMWVTTIAYNKGAFTPSEPTVNAWLSAPPKLGETPADRDLYLRLFYDTHEGVPYYDAYARVYQSDPLGEFRLPNGVPGYRLPTLFALWLLLPAQGTSLPLAFLIFATLAVCSAFAIGMQLGPPRLAVLGALMVAAAYLTISTSSFVVFVDGWAMAVTLAGLALFIASLRQSSRKLLWAAMLVMLFAATMREILVYPMLLAGASALVQSKGTWRKELWPWLAGLGMFSVIYAAHAVAIAGRVDKAGSVGFWMNGGLAHLVATLRFFDQLFGGAPLFVPVLVFSGLAGAVLVARKHKRLGAFLVAAVGIPHITFLFFGSAGRDMVTGSVPGYWGMLVVPIALALAPVAIAEALRLNDNDSKDSKLSLLA